MNTPRISTKSGRFPCCLAVVMFVAGWAGAARAGAPGSIPAAHLEAVARAKTAFERREYSEAEKIYESVLIAAPENLYVLSNLGVVRFRAGKLKLAEEALEKATAVAPGDAFSHCTLGIVYYSQGKYDEAVEALTKALSIEPRNATAHRYLGVVFEQKGWFEEAAKEFETTERLDPFPKKK